MKGDFLNKKIILAGILATTVFLAGCDKPATTTDDVNTTDAPAVTETQNETNNTEATEGTEAANEPNEAAGQHEEQYGVNDAIEKFKTEFPNAQITSVSYDYDDRYQYDITGREQGMEHELKLDAKSGQTKVKSENEDDAFTAIDEKYLEKIDEMINKSLDEFASANGTDNMIAKEWELEFDDGVLEFKSEVVSGNKSTEYKYNVVNEF